MFKKGKKAPLKVVRFSAAEPNDTPRDDTRTPSKWTLRYSVFGRRQIDFTPGVKFLITGFSGPRKSERHGWFHIKVLNNKGREVATARLYIDSYDPEIHHNLPHDYMEGRTLVVI